MPKSLAAVLLTMGSVNADPKFKQTSGLDMQLEKWMPRELPQQERDKFKSKFYKLADAAKPLVGSHPIHETHNHGGFIRDSEFAEYLNLYFEFSSAQDLVAGFSFQLMNDLFLYNIEDCTFWSFDTFSDFANGALLLMEDNNAS